LLLLSDLPDGNGNLVYRSGCRWKNRVSNFTHVAGVSFGRFAATSGATCAGRYVWPLFFV
jgi:hypothetical protein